jgi:hypothetical protein
MLALIISRPETGFSFGMSFNAQRCENRRFTGWNLGIFIFKVKLDCFPQIT